MTNTNGIIAVDFYGKSLLVKEYKGQFFYLKTNIFDILELGEDKAQDILKNVLSVNSESHFLNFDDVRYLSIQSKADISNELPMFIIFNIVEPINHNYAMGLLHLHTRSVDMDDNFNNFPDAKSYLGSLVESEFSDTNTFEGRLYIVQLENKIKIGQTANIVQRFKTLRRQFEAVGEHVIGVGMSAPHTNYKLNEKLVLNHFSQYRINESELFSIAPYQAIAYMDKLSYNQNNADLTHKFNIDSENTINGFREILFPWLPEYKLA